MPCDLYAPPLHPPHHSCVCVCVLELYITSPDLQPEGVRARHEKVSACSSRSLILLVAASLRRVPAHSYNSPCPNLTPRPYPYPAYFPSFILERPTCGVSRAYLLAACPVETRTPTTKPRKKWWHFLRGLTRRTFLNFYLVLQFYFVVRTNV
jgi:hypothetical protein